MSAAAITVAALLVASPSITDADRIAANGGFLVGNAHRCGVDEARVTRAGQLIRTLITAASRDDETEEEATARFSAFFLVSAVADPKTDKLVASCKRITAELRRLESHQPDQALVGSDDGAPATGLIRTRGRRVSSSFARGQTTVSGVRTHISALSPSSICIVAW